MKQKQNHTFEHLGSLITYKDNGVDRCLGYLMHFKEHGVYDASLGRVDIPPEFVDPHNNSLATAEIDGLDNTCEIGQGGTFYLGRPTDRTVKTFTGVIVATEVTVRNKSITFRRAGKEYRGRLGNSESFNFRRVR